jgi:hypothetical protein
VVSILASKEASFYIDLKGQCHEMVVEIRPWSGRLGLSPKLMTAKPYFQFKITHLKAMVYSTVYRSESNDVKTRFPDLADFTTTLLLIHWHIAL